MCTTNKLITSQNLDAIMCPSLRVTLKCVHTVLLTWSVATNADGPTYRPVHIKKTDDICFKGSNKPQQENLNLSAQSHMSIYLQRFLNPSSAPARFNLQLFFSHFSCFFQLISVSILYLFTNDNELYLLDSYKHHIVYKPFLLIELLIILSTRIIWQLI